MCWRLEETDRKSHRETEGGKEGGRSVSVEKSENSALNSVDLKPAALARHVQLSKPHETGVSLRK